MIKPYNTVIWDWNGTLLDDVDTCVNITNKILERQAGKQLTIHSYKEAFGFPIVDYYARIGIDFSPKNFDELTKEFIGDYMSQVKSCPLQQSSINVLQTLQAREMKQFILTAAHKDSVIELLDHFGIGHFFEAIEGLDNYRAESKVQRGHHLITNNQINPKSTVLVGDTMHDYEVAQALGVDCILVAAGHQSKARLEAKTQNQIPVIEELSQIL